MTVQTYHGIAMRITGTSFAELTRNGRQRSFPSTNSSPMPCDCFAGEGNFPDFLR